jgi:superfamily II DNA or RNA helicase
MQSDTERNQVFTPRPVFLSQKAQEYAFVIQVDPFVGNCYFTPQDHPAAVILNQQIRDTGCVRTQGLPRRWVSPLNDKQRVSKIIDILTSNQQVLDRNELSGFISDFALYGEYKGFAVAGILLGFNPALKVRLSNISPDVQINQLNQRCNVQWKRIAEFYEVPFEHGDEYLATLNRLGVKVTWEILESGQSAESVYQRYRNQPNTQKLIKASQFREGVSVKRRAFLDKIARKWRLFDFRALCIEKTGQTLNTAQERAIKAILQAIEHNLHGFILALDMGLGKTRLAALLAISAGVKTLIIAPGTVHGQWQKEISLLDKEKTIGRDYWLSTWDCRSLVKFKQTEIEFIIADESHYVNGNYKKTMQAGQFLALSERAMFVLCLTGTPARNSHPANLVTMLKAIGAIFTSNQEKEFKSKFVKDLQNMLPGARYERLLSLAEWLKPAMLVVNAESTLQMPDINYSVQRIEASLKCQEAILFSYKNLSLNANDEYAVILQSLNSLRKSFALAKIESACAEVKARLHLGEQVVVFSTFIDILRAIASKVANMGVFTSTTTPRAEKRNKMLDDFHSGRLRVLGTTYGFGGAGLNLQQASTVIFVDLPWTANACRQAIARIYRQGQEKVCNVVYISCSLQQMPSHLVNIDKFLEGIIIEKAVLNELILHDKADQTVKSYYNKLIGQLSQESSRYGQTVGI